MMTVTIITKPKRKVIADAVMEIEKVIVKNKSGNILTGCGLNRSDRLSKLINRCSQRRWQNTSDKPRRSSENGFFLVKCKCHQWERCSRYFFSSICLIRSPSANLFLFLLIQKMRGWKAGFSAFALRHDAEFWKGSVFEGTPVVSEPRREHACYMTDVRIRDWSIEQWSIWWVSRRHAPSAVESSTAFCHRQWPKMIHITSQQERARREKYLSRILGSAIVEVGEEERSKILDDTHNILSMKFRLEIISGRKWQISMVTPGLAHQCFDFERSLKEQRCGRSTVMTGFGSNLVIARKSWQTGPVLSLQTTNLLLAKRKSKQYSECYPLQSTRCEHMTWFIFLELFSRATV